MLFHQTNLTVINSTRDIFYFLFSFIHFPFHQTSDGLFFSFRLHLQLYASVFCSLVFSYCLIVVISVSIFHELDLDKLSFIYAALLHSFPAVCFLCVFHFPFLLNHSHFYHFIFHISRFCNAYVITFCMKHRHISRHPSKHIPFESSFSLNTFADFITMLDILFTSMFYDISTAYIDWRLSLPISKDNYLHSSFDVKSV